MILKERVRLIWGFVFLLLATGLTIYFIYLVANYMISDATLILALLTAVLALAITLLNNVKLKNKWK